MENLRRSLPTTAWNTASLRAEAVVDRCLQDLTDTRQRATFFVLGWLAARRPALVRRIADAGHEVACHGFGHELVYTLTREAFRSDVARARALLEDITGRAVVGYRAPCFSITDWAIDELHDLGFAYDSSAVPVAAHDRYGKLTGLDRDQPIQDIRPGLTEVCVSVRPIAGCHVPWGGGGYFRLLPYRVFREGIERILADRGCYVFYTHPWEFDPDQPRIEGLGPLARFRHYVNLDRTEARWRRLLADFRWTTVADLVARHRGTTTLTPPSPLPLSAT